MAAPSPRKKKRSPKRPQKPQPAPVDGVRVTADQLVAVLRERAAADQRIADLLQSAQWEAATRALLAERQELMAKVGNSEDSESEDD